MLGINLGKASCGVVGLDAAGGLCCGRRRATRYPRGCGECRRPGGAHQLGRAARTHGHRVKLMLPPEYVRPCVKARKNDGRYTEAITEAASRPTMRSVPPKPGAQLDSQALRRARAVGRRAHGAGQPDAGAAAGARRLAGAAAAGAGFLGERDSGERQRDRRGGPGPRATRGMRSEWQGLDRRVEAFGPGFAAAIGRFLARLPPAQCARCLERRGYERSGSLRIKRRPAWPFASR